MDSEGRIVEVMLGTEFSDFDRRTGDHKTRPKNWCRQFARKVGPSANSVRYYLLLIFVTAYQPYSSESVIVHQFLSSS